MLYKHGHRPQSGPSPTYSSWNAMMSRCYQPKSYSYNSYGAKGITVCERWKTFKNFLQDMGERPEGCTLGRNGDLGNYEPGNVSWQTKAEQARFFEKNPRAKLTEEQILCCAALAVPGLRTSPTYRQMSVDLGVSCNTVSTAIRRYFK